MGLRRFATLAGVLVLVVGLLPVAGAVGASYGTKVIVSLKTPAFHGKLKSSRSACETGRTVKLFRKKAGADRLLGSDRSSPAGKWSVRIKLRSGASYYAKAAAKGSCRAAKSKVLTIG